MLDQKQLEQHTYAACAAVQETAAFIQGELGKVNRGQIEEKFLNGLVSYVDKQAEQMLVARLSKILPEAAFITEEETVAQAEQADLQWIIDPLDGTTNFLFGLPHFSISVALKAGNNLVIGIVHHVSAGELFYAWQGGGAWCNGAPIQVSKRQTLQESLIATGFPYHDFGRSESWFTAVKTFMAQTRGIRRFGSAALDMAWVACGRFDLFFEYGLNAWDVAGGAVLVREAGGQVFDFSGGPDFIAKQEVFASNAGVSTVGLDVIRRAFQG